MKDIETNILLALSLTVELFEKDLDKGLKWFQSPTDLLFGATPFEVCARGDSEYLINWLKGRLGYPDAKEF